MTVHVTPPGYRSVIVIGGPQQHAGTTVDVQKNLRWLTLESSFGGHTHYSVERMPLQITDRMTGYVWIARHSGTDPIIALELLIMHFVRLAGGEVRP